MPFGIFGGRFDIQEFIFGLVLGFLLVSILRRTKPAIFTFYEWIRNRAKAGLESLTSSSEEPYYEELQFRLDNLHLANPLFPFRTIIIPPRLLIPTPATDPTQLDPSEELYHAILPALPDWNALESIYQTPTLPITHLLNSGENILITGELGSGKTSALIYLAQTSLDRIKNEKRNAHKIPIYLHAADLDLSRKTTKDPLNVVIESVRQSSSIGLARFISRYLRLRLNNSPALILVDGLDELTIKEIRAVFYWLDDLKTKYPQHQIIAAAAPRGQDKLLDTGLFPVAIAPWNSYDLERYLKQWANAWQTYVFPQLPKDRVGDVDPVLLNSWLRSAKVGYNPLEVTVKVWAFYVGDTQGSTLENALQAYIRRILSPNEQHSAQAIGLTWVRSRRSVLSPTSFDKRALIQDLLNAKILNKRFNEQISFTNPSIGAFLAAGGMLIAKKIHLDPLDYWEPARAAFRYFAAIGEPSHLVASCLQSEGDALGSALLTCAKWLARGREGAPWRNQILGRLAKIIQDETKPYSLKLRVVQALIATNEQSAKALFQQLLKSQEEEGRTLAIIGLGGLKNNDYIQALRHQIDSDGNPQIRFASCLALAAIGTIDALQALGHYLLNGDDACQIYAAQALATHPGEGVPMLHDAVEMESVRVRRAAVFGLGRVQDDHVLELLKKIQLEDSQAIVKNAATDILELRMSPVCKLSFPADQIASLPWLIQYAADKGFGVTPGKGALESLRRVLISGEQLEKVASLEAVGFFRAHELLMETTQAMKDKDPLIRDAAFNALWQLHATMVKPSKSKQKVPQ
jgi:HEAT repeat protein